MQIIKGTHANKEPIIGGKANGLVQLQQLGLIVPKWVVIPHNVLLDLLPAAILNESYANIRTYINTLVLPTEFVNEISAQFSKQTLLAVRSSAVDEDGGDFSFAGQFESYLGIANNELAIYIKKVWCSAFSERVAQYRNINHLQNNPGIAIIIQEMIIADSSGVAFGINPVTGNRNEHLISAVYGVGEGLVSGECNADNYYVTANGIVPEIVEKNHQFVLDNTTTGGLKKVQVENSLTLQPVLSDEKINAISAVLKTCRLALGKPQDIEFAIADNTLFILQCRPITVLQKIADKTGNYILWDNSNIIESYPGVTTPLTFSFISKSYEQAYKLFSNYMGVSQKVIQQNAHIFANTLGLLNGRVYYNLRSWYHMLALLPGYHINARFMENMMGVKERFDIPENYHLSKRAAWWAIVKMAVKMYQRFLSLPRKRHSFNKLLDKTIDEYNKINYTEKNGNELKHLYLNFEKKLLNEWKAPLLNDFFAMVWFGLLQNQCKKYAISNNPNIHNDLLCGSSDIISTQPIHFTINIATFVVENEPLLTLFTNENEQNIWQTLNDSNEKLFVEAKDSINGYLDAFGERCVGELKLETISYTQDPTKYVKILQSYVKNGITNKATSTNLEKTIRATAEKEINAALKNRPIKKWLLRRTVKKARELVSARENLRYQRTRAFGIVRTIFSNLGNWFYAENILDHPRDVFYLTKEEIFAFMDGTSVTQNIKKLVAIRKAEYEDYQKMPQPSERFATYGMVYHANNFFSDDKSTVLSGELKGIGCCPGIVKAKVKVVTNPGEINSLNGDILITSSTDPGWVTLFPTASGIIVERGSLLSHSAIVSREMGIPCIVGVTGLLKTLQTGDIVEMDGSTGLIRIISKQHESTT